MRSFCSVLLVLLLLGAQQPEPVEGWMGLFNFLPHAIKGIGHLHNLFRGRRSLPRRLKFLRKWNDDAGKVVGKE